MHRQRLAIPIVAILLSFSMAACSSGGSAKTGTQGAGAQNITTSTPAAGSTTAPSDERSLIASTPFCQAALKDQQDSEKVDDGDPSVTTEVLRRDVDEELATAPAEIKGDMQTLYDAALAELAKGNTSVDLDSRPELQAAGDRVSNWVVAHCAAHH